MRILLTGSNGFIGKNLVNNLSDNHKIVACSRKTVNFKNNVKNLIVSDLDSLKFEDFYKVDVLVHAAGIAHKSLSLSVKKQITEVNINKTERLFLLARKAGVKKIIFLSSVSVYGELTNLKGVNELNRLNPANYYAFSKKKNEDFLIKISKNSNLTYTILRLPLVYGRNAPGSFESINRYINKKYFFPIPVLDNENQRTFCNVQNISDKIEEVLENINSSTIMNIVNPDSFSTFALISSVLKRRRNHVLRIPVNDFFNKLLLRIPFLNNFYKKYYSNFVVSSIHHKAIFEDVDFSTINDVGKFLK